jgi:hypothetical protein
MNDATNTKRDRNGNIIPDLNSVWEPEGDSRGLALATVVATRSSEETRVERERRRGW